MPPATTTSHRLKVHIGQHHNLRQLFFFVSPRFAHDPAVATTANLHPICLNLNASSVPTTTHRECLQHLRHLTTSRDYYYASHFFALDQYYRRRSYHCNLTRATQLRPPPSWTPPFAVASPPLPHSVDPLQSSPFPNSRCMRHVSSRRCNVTICWSTSTACPTVKYILVLSLHNHLLLVLQTG